MLRLTVLARPAAFAAVLALVLTGLGPAAPAQRQGPITVHTSETSRAVDGPTDFELAAGTTHIAIRWAGHPDAQLAAAFSRDGSTFEEPQHVDLDEVGAAKHDGETYGAIMVANHARVVRVTTDEPLDKVTVLALDAGAVATPLPGVGATAAGVTGIPGVIPRAGWGADETIRFDPYGEERWWSQYFPLQKLIVHHTAGSNVDPNPAATVRAIYHYHAVTQDWGDIGYNYLIDSAGRIYEGRHSRSYWYGASPTSDDGTGLVIAGGHALYHNAGTMGIALMGDFTSQAPTTAARGALTSLLTWAADEYNINPLGASTYVNPVSGVTRTTPNIAGHRDYNQTGCPGSALWNLLPGIRTAVANAVNSWQGETFNPPRNVSIGAGSHTGYRFNSAGGVIGSKPFTLGAPSSAPTSTRARITGQGNVDWYLITAGIWSGYWLPASSSVVLGSPGGTVQNETYSPYAPLQLAAGTYVGFRFNTWGTQTASRAMTLSAPSWVPVVEKSTIPGKGATPYYYVTTGTLEGYWLPESGSTTLGTLPMASFTPSQVTGIAPLTVGFSNTSVTYGPTTWAWDFESDGVTDSTAQSPLHEFPAPGTYTVTLTVSDFLDTDTAAATITVRPPQEGTYVPLSSSRLLDTRSGNGLAGAFSAGVPRSFDVAGRGGVPDGAIAVTGNLTVTGQSSAGFLTLGPDPAPLPTTSSLNFPAGDSRANGVTVALAGDGSLSVTYSAPAGASTHVVFDVTGYFKP